MRDPQRIDRILNLIAVAWRRNPDQRLGQLLYNYAGFEGDIFNYEDDRTEQKLQEFIMRINRKEEGNP
jgi:uncharacterized protein YihD (DUF1040 family)